MKKILTMTTCVVIAGALAFAGCKKNEIDFAETSKGNDDALQTFTLAGTADSSLVNPLPVGAVNGLSQFSGTYNARTNTLNYTVTYSGLTGAPTAGAFYSGDATDSTGTMMGNTWNLSSGTTTGTTTGSGTYKGSATLTNEQAADLLGGRVFYQLSTSANTAGEVRGQIGRG